MEKKWYKSKTVWTGIAGLVAAVGGYVTGEVVASDALQMAFVAFTGMFLRAGIGLKK